MKIPMLNRSAHADVVLKVWKPGDGQYGALAKTVDLIEVHMFKTK